MKFVKETEELFTEINSVWDEVEKYKIMLWYVKGPVFE